MKRIPVITIIVASIVLITGFTVTSHHGPVTVNAAQDQTKGMLLTGAAQTEKYLPYLKRKRVGILANPTTIIGNKHLVDSLQARGVNIVKVFGPEHGFRGNASAGARRRFQHEVIL